MEVKGNCGSQENLNITGHMLARKAKQKPHMTPALWLQSPKKCLEMKKGTAFDREKNPIFANF